MKSKFLNIIFIVLSFSFFITSLYFLGDNNIFLFSFFVILSIGILIGYIVENKNLFIYIFSNSKNNKIHFYEFINILIVFIVLFLLYLFFFFGVISFKKDITSSSVFSLSDKTVAYLKTLEKDVVIKVFDEKNDRDYAQNIIREYEKESSHINVEYINPFLRADMAEKFNVKEQGAIVVSVKDKPSVLLRVDDLSYDGQNTQSINRSLFVETKLILAIKSLLLSDKDKKKVGFYILKGTRSLLNIKNNGLSRLGRLLLLERLKLSQGDVNDREFLKELDLLVISSLKEDLSINEMNNIIDFLDRGGSMILLYDPLIDNRGKRLNNVVELAKRYHVFFNDDLIIDKKNYLTTLNGKQGAFFQPEIKMAEIPAFKPLLDSNYKIYMFTARSLFYTENIVDYKPEVLLSTMNTAYGEKSLKNRFEYDPKIDSGGPLNVMVSLSSRTRKNQKIIFGGDSAFISNYMSSIKGNNELFKNVVLYALGQDNFTVETKKVTQNYIMISYNFKMIAILIFVIIIPFLILLYGLLHYYSRRKNNREKK